MTKIEIAANVAVGAILFIINVKFSVAYFSYIVVVSLLFLLYDFCQSRKLHINYFPPFSAIKWMIIAIVTLYGTVFLSSIALQDVKSIGWSKDLLSFSMPFWVVWFISAKYPVERGAMLGILGGCAVNCLYGMFMWMGMPEQRAAGYWQHPNTFGTVLQMEIPFLLYYGICIKRDIGKWISGSLICIALVCLYLTESRGAILTLLIAVCGTALVLLITRKWSWKDDDLQHTLKLGGVGMLLCIALGIGMAGAIQSNRDGMGQIGGERIMMIESSYKMWQDHKLWGIGINRWGEYYYKAEYHPEQGKEKNHVMPHNMLMYFWAGAGIFGGIGWIVFIISSFWAMLGCLKIYQDIAFSAAMMVVFLGFILHSFVDATIMDKMMALIFYGFLGYYFGAVQRR